MLRKNVLLVLITALFSFNAIAGDSDADWSSAFAGLDLHLKADKMTVNQIEPSEYLILFENNFSMAIANSNFSADNAVLKIILFSSIDRGIKKTDYKCLVYLQDNIVQSSSKKSKTIDIYKKPVYQGQGLALRFFVTGQIYSTAQTKSQENILEDVLVQKALAVLVPLENDIPQTVVQKGAEIPKIERLIDTQKLQVAAVEEQKAEAASEEKLPLEKPTPVEPKFQYPVNISGLGGDAIKIDSQRIETSDGLSAAVITGRFYLWQKLDDNGNILELLGDNAVIYYASGQVDFGNDDSSANGAIQSIYLQGNIEITEGDRTINADECFYDFQTRQAMAVNAVMRSYDYKRNIPIYVKAERLRQVSENQFTAENIVLTSSEFYEPQIKMTASTINVVDTAYVDEQAGKTNDSSYQAEIKDVKFYAGKVPFFYWPKLTGNTVRPDVPIKSAHISYDSDFGASLETRWYLSRLLGLREPNGVDSTLALDYYGERGTGVGVDIEYEGADNNGRILAYLINDRGEDDLGRTRENLEPERDLRGRFTWQHRQYLPDDWQLTAEFSYLSDRNFLEGYYRNEFNTDKEQETLIHLKKTYDNRSISILNKIRINDFQTTTDELPTVEYHITGESIFDDRFTMFSDNRISRLRERYAEGSAAEVAGLNQNFYTYGESRQEIDLPLTLNRIKIVPFGAVNFGYDDLDGFDTRLGGANDPDGEKSAAIGELGLRASTTYWKHNPNFTSSFWDLNGIRHIIKPHFEAVVFEETDQNVKQRDIFNIGLLQRWQTKRSGSDTVIDWMRLGIDATFVNNDADNITGPDKYIWNRPFQPLFYRRNSDGYGITRDKINADYVWNLTDTTAFLSDINYDIEGGTVGQCDVGISHYRYPDLSYYIGSRYLRDVQVNNEKGSHSFIYAITYKLNERYAVVFGQEYNFDYGKSVESEITFIRKYHRLNYSLTFNVDSSLGRSGAMFSIWPDGVKELGLGSRKFYGLMGN